MVKVGASGTSRGDLCGPILSKPNLFACEKYYSYKVKTACICVIVLQSFVPIAYRYICYTDFPIKLSIKCKQVFRLIDDEQKIHYSLCLGRIKFVVYI